MFEFPQVAIYKTEIEEMQGKIGVLQMKIKDLEAINERSSAYVQEGRELLNVLTKLSVDAEGIDQWKQVVVTAIDYLPKQAEQESSTQQDKQRIASLNQTLSLQLAELTELRNSNQELTRKLEAVDLISQKDTTSNDEEQIICEMQEELFKLRAEAEELRKSRDEHEDKLKDFIANNTANELRLMKEVEELKKQLEQAGQEKPEKPKRQRRKKAVESVQEDEAASPDTNAVVDCIPPAPKLASAELTPDGDVDMINTPAIASNFPDCEFRVGDGVRILLDDEEGEIVEIYNTGLFGYTAKVQVGDKQRVIASEDLDLIPPEIMIAGDSEESTISTGCIVRNTVSRKIGTVLGAIELNGITSNDVFNVRFPDSVINCHASKLELLQNADVVTSQSEEEIEVPF